MTILKSFHPPSFVLLLLAHEAIMAKSPRKCIFCGAGKLTREHIWADWLRNYIPRDMQKHVVRTQIVYPTHSETTTKKRGGDVRSTRVKCVCGPCNSGWMGDLQEAAKPIAIPLIRGQPILLDKSAQNTICAWIAMSVIAADLTQPEKSAIPDTDRKWLYEKRTAPLKWRIWIGDYERSEWPIHIARHLVALTEEPVPNAAPLTLPEPPNTQAMTYVTGRLFVHVISTPVEKAVMRWGYGPRGNAVLRKLQPYREAISWPARPVMNDKDAHAISNAFFNRVTSPDIARWRTPD